VPASVPDLTAHIGYWLRQVSNHVSHAFARKLAAKDVTVAEWALMRVLYRTEPTLPSRLAEKMGLTRGAITKLADRLIAKALVVREADPDDGRVQTLSLTPRGIRFVPALAALAEQNEAECFAHLTEDERRLLKNVLQQIVSRLGLTSMPIT
jgi:MarR family transcriptional regulator, lower aerobic nicotinate degradation pathway regulator